jgi:predicted small metal-binding protein
MKKSLGCKDLGISTCSFEARSENSVEIKDALFAHAQKYHAEKVANMSDQQKTDMSRMMDQKIK